jgi:hypothetical protein
MLTITNNLEDAVGVVVASSLYSFRKKLILNKYQNYKKRICKFHEAFIFKVLVYYSVLKFHVRDY